MVRPGKLGDLGGAYVTFIMAPKAASTAADATIRVYTNIPPIARIQQAVRINWASNGTNFSTNKTIVRKTSNPAAGQVTLADYRTFRCGDASTIKQAFLIIARLAPEGYSGAQDDRL